MQKNAHISIVLLILVITFLILLNSCQNRDEKSTGAPEKMSFTYKKPGSGYRDSLHIYNKAVIIYQPDSLQLIQIKASMDSSVFDGTMHEFYYQIRNAGMVIRSTWPELPLINVKNYRYLVFHKKDSSREIIDLDEKNDACGMYLFENEKPPQPADMMNIETALSNYFNK